MGASNEEKEGTMNQRHFAHWPRRLPHSLAYPKRLLGGS